MELRHLHTFHEVAAARTFVRAARALGCSQGTVTVHIQRLEAALGVALFARHGKRVTLSEAGRALAGYTGPFLRHVDTIREALAGYGDGTVGHIRIGAIEPAASRRLIPALAAFHRSRPRVRVEVEVGGTHTIAAMVAARQLDVGIASPPPPKTVLRAIHGLRLELLVGLVSPLDGAPFGRALLDLVELIRGPRHARPDTARA